MLHERVPKALEPAALAEPRAPLTRAGKPGQSGENRGQGRVVEHTWMGSSSVGREAAGQSATLKIEADRKMQT
jgi:hypothetical protein